MEISNNDALKLNLDNYTGPIDVLLDLAKSQKVDLANISITRLADQFLDFISKSKALKLDLASEYLLMATWLAYLKSKLLLPQDDDEDFKVSEVAEKLKLQLKKLELIRLLSAQLLKKKILGKDVFMRGMSGGIRSIHTPVYKVNLYDILRTYSDIQTKRNFLSINIPKLPVYTTEDGIETIKKNLHTLKDWVEIINLIPKKFKTSKKIKRTGISGIFAASLELSKQGVISIMQKRIFDKILIKHKQ
jgi:segregation and condensation protein A